MIARAPVFMPCEVQSVSYFISVLYRSRRLHASFIENAYFGMLLLACVLTAAMIALGIQVFPTSNAARALGGF